MPSKNEASSATSSAYSIVFFRFPAFILVRWGIPPDPSGASDKSRCFSAAFVSAHQRPLLPRPPVSGSGKTPSDLFHLAPAVPPPQPLGNNEYWPPREALLHRYSRAVRG